MSYAIVGIICFVAGVLSDHFLEIKIRAKVADALSRGAAATKPNPPPAG